MPPAYNAAQTLEITYRGLDRSVVDDVLLVDDHSSDETLAVANKLGIRSCVHGRNLGYGANQKSCYTLALLNGADIVIMVHPSVRPEARDGDGRDDRERCLRLCHRVADHRERGAEGRDAAIQIRLNRCSRLPETA